MNFADIFKDGKKRTFCTGMISVDGNKSRQPFATILMEIDLVRDYKRQRSNIFSTIGIFYNRHRVTGMIMAAANAKFFEPLRAPTIPMVNPLSPSSESTN
jgi:hypothetical protein